MGTEEDLAAFVGAGVPRTRVPVMQADHDIARIRVEHIVLVEHFEIEFEVRAGVGLASVAEDNISI